MAYKYGAIIPDKTLFVWNGIGCCHMRDWIGRIPRQQHHFADGEPLAQLQNPGFGDHVLPLRALAQEVDVEIGGHGEPDGPIADNNTTYIAQSASVISVAPETVPPGRNMNS